jgi:hypothetical protein
LGLVPGRRSINERKTRIEGLDIPDHAKRLAALQSVAIAIVIELMESNAQVTPNRPASTG